jgi:ribulose 1,5-bisphosphate carboxylase large subunit-like protein
MNIYRTETPLNHIKVDFYVESRTTLAEACEGIAIGQSIGNPSVRIYKWETEDLVLNHSAKIIGDRNELLTRQSGIVSIAFPFCNINWKEDGFSQLLCTIMGGQTDIDIISKCHVLDLDGTLIPKLSPRYGLSGLRELTGQYNKPLLGCIIKPKIGLNAKDYGSIVKEMVDGGADIIKEDEILANPYFCSMEDRLPIVQDILKGTKVVYLTCINGDADRILDKAKLVSKMGVNGVHINVWSGLGTYAAVRRLNLPITIHYQKSGDKAFTHVDNPYRISWKVLCKLASYSGVDTIHAGMWGGYLSDDPNELKAIMDQLTNQNVVPALSCGMNAVLIPKVTEKFGVDYLANVGSACHSNPNGVYAGVKALRNAIDAN